MPVCLLDVRLRPRHAAKGGRKVHLLQTEMPSAETVQKVFNAWSGHQACHATQRLLLTRQLRLSVR